MDSTHSLSMVQAGAGAGGGVVLCGIFSWHTLGLLVRAMSPSSNHHWITFGLNMKIPQTFKYLTFN